MDICLTEEYLGKDVEPKMSKREFCLNRASSVMYSGANPHKVM